MMNVKELIEKLQKLPLNAEVKTWDCYGDVDTRDVHVSTDGENVVWIMYTTIGYEKLQDKDDE